MKMIKDWWKFASIKFVHCKYIAHLRDDGIAYRLKTSDGQEVFYGRKNAESITLVVFMVPFLIFYITFVLGLAIHKLNWPSPVNWFLISLTVIAYVWIFLSKKFGYLMTFKIRNAIYNDKLR